MDSYHTPLSNGEQMYGVEIHANITQMLLEDNIKRNIPTWAGLLWLVIVIVLAVLLKIPHMGVMLIAFAALGTADIFLARWLFSLGFICPLLYPLLTLAAFYVAHAMYSYTVAIIERRRVRSAFMKYVDPKLVESGEADSDEVGVLKDVAVLFVDIRGFTSISEALSDSPDIVVSILNEYLELTSTAIFNNGGSVDKLIGDATMGIFNGFVPLDDYVYNAVKAARDIVSGAAELNSSIKSKYGVDVSFGVGVNCGRAVVGNIDPSFRKDYTAIGDTVNVAARLESNAKRSQILISRDVYELIKDKFNADSIGEIPLKGKTEKVEIFSVETV